MHGPLQCNREAKLERHVEARSSGSLSVRLHAREIVDGVPRFMDQPENAVKAALAERYLQSGARSKSVGADGGNICEQEIFKSRVVGHIQKN